MAQPTVFVMDGTAYNINVIQLTRKFSVLDTDNSGRTIDGEMYRDPIGTFYNYTMTVEPMTGDPAAMDAFWDAISQPVPSHVCTFPYHQQTLTQRMYITSGEQSLRRLTARGTHWDRLTIHFVAMGPKVTP